MSARTGRPQIAFPRLSAVVKKLIIALVAAYVAQLVLTRLGVPVASLLALTPAGPDLWQLVTYVLVDSSVPIMFLLGLLFLWWALSPFEISYGPKRTLQLCGVALVSASVPAYLVGFVLPGAPVLYGSSPLWIGAIAATAWLYRDQQISLFGAMPMTARTFLLLIVGLSVLNFLFTMNYTHLIAELGAMGGCIGFVRWMKRPRRPSAPRKPAARPRPFKVIEGGGGEDDDRPKWLN